MKTLPVAVQVYSVREDAEKDFAGTMKKIKEIGYDGVELAGLYGLEPAAIKAAIEDAGLVALSAHVPFQELVADMEGTIQKYVEIGMKYIAIPYLMAVSYTHLDVYKRQRPGGQGHHHRDQVRRDGPAALQVPAPVPHCGLHHPGARVAPAEPLLGRGARLGGRGG